MLHGVLSSIMYAIVTVTSNEPRKGYEYFGTLRVVPLFLLGTFVRVWHQMEFGTSSCSYLLLHMWPRNDLVRVVRALDMAGDGQARLSEEILSGLLAQEGQL